MKYLKAFVAGMSVFLVQPVAAQNSLSAEQTQFIEILAGNGCGMAVSDARVIFPENNMSFSTADQIAEELFDMGIASIAADGETLVIGPDYCEADASSGVENNDSGAAIQLTADQTKFIEILTPLGCRMTEDQMKTALPENGMSARTGDQMADELMDLGIAIVSDDRMSLMIVAEYCTPAATPTPDPVAGLSADNADAMYLSGTQVQQFIGIMAENGCSLHQSNIEEVFNQPGMMPDDMDQIAETLMDLRLAVYSRETRLLTLHSSICSPIAGQAVAEPSSAESPEGIFVSVMVGNGCVLTELDARQIFPAAGLAMEDVYVMADDYIAQGNGYFSEDDTTFTLTIPECSITADTVTIEAAGPADDGAAISGNTNPEAQFLEILALNGCELSQASARDVIGASGMDYNAAMVIAAQMLNDGRATSPDGGQTLQISAPLCVASGAGGPLEPRDIFMNLLQANNCSITAGEFSTLLPVGGLDQNTAFGLISELEAEGIISLPPTRDVVTLTAGNCR